MLLFTTRRLVYSEPSRFAPPPLYLPLPGGASIRPVLAPFLREAFQSALCLLPSSGRRFNPPLLCPLPRGRRMNPSMGLGGGCPAADTPARKGAEKRLALALSLKRRPSRLRYSRRGRALQSRPLWVPFFLETHDYSKLDLKGQEYIPVACSGILPPILQEEGNSQRACGMPILIGSAPTEASLRVCLSRECWSQGWRNQAKDGVSRERQTRKEANPNRLPRGESTQTGGSVFSRCGGRGTRRRDSRR